MFQAAPLIFGPLCALAGRLVCKMVTNSLNIPPQPFKQGGNNSSIFFSFLRSFCHLLTLAIVGEIPSFSLLVMLVVVVLSTYPLSMVAVEMVPSIYNNSFLLVMLKYVVGTTHHLIVPLGILAVRTDLR